jgi:FG-GAP-like repeat
MTVIRRFVWNLVLFSTVVAGITSNILTAGEPAKFEELEIDSRVGDVCYAVTLSDVDGDGRRDVVAVTENRVVWYRNPDWKPRVIIADKTERDNVCIAPYDIDGDGRVDFALGAGWLNNTHLGTLYWLTRGKSLDEPWHVHAIGRESWTHRVRWGDLLGTGRPQLLVSPLTKTLSEGVRVLAFEIPAHPEADPWKSTVVDAELNAMHNHWMGDLDGDGATDLITASLEGVFLFRRDAKGALRKTRIGEGAEGPKEPQKSGAGEIRVGRFKGGGPYLATVEPMHGHQIVIYTPPANESNSTLWRRNVLDDSLKRGHALGVADVDHDGHDDLIIGHSDKGTGNPAGPGVFYFAASDRIGEKWPRHTIDNGGIATEDLDVGDLNGDGWPDIVAGGRATHNLKIYLNQPPP